MSKKEPLLTRAKIRELKEQESKLNKLKELELQKQFEAQEKKIGKLFSKEKKKVKSVKGSRAVQTEKIHERSSFLTKAIIIVVLLLVMMFLAVKYL
ncbi:cell wall synthase accessory phosphoprotein MacP [uncultured Vagococcus sp.]|uniref:cell wall synthase accessory phosphoprotein MacP n=1 Tax=uncultured Vagococcus sp. TaxID=189676 RepID=UPI0028D47469|nr:cell wall synthase accessory phosphoprotein MacP [uncultured Vagococcus sp.]